MENSQKQGVTSRFKSRSAALSTADITLNYVWINKERFEPKAEGPLCGVPLNMVDKAIQNAKNYPKASVNLWVDASLLDDASMTLLVSHIYIAGAANIKVRDLAEISGFVKCKPLFDPAFLPDKSDIFSIQPQRYGDNIWGRVDLARVMAIHQSLAEGAKYAFYADFDIEETFLDDPMMHRVLMQYDMVFGATRDRQPIIENSYFGFASAPHILNALGQLVVDTARDVSRGYNGYESYYRMAREFAKSQGFEEDFIKHLGFPAVGHPMGYRIPKKELYAELGLNEPEASQY